MLPKSLHTVRILAAVAAQVLLDNRAQPDIALQAVRKAAAIIGYPDASADDPLIIKAAASLAKVRA